jgi:hypothetical protein
VGKKDRKIKSLKRKVRKQEKQLEGLDVMVNHQRWVIRELRQVGSRWACANCGRMVAKWTVIRPDGHHGHRGWCSKCGHGPVAKRGMEKAQ